ncbi:hypothetical protein ACIBQ1_54275 [Nonomuraea sp. NPDC050153]|uniref:hypothetical protein n=1 Tax=Nonomuraea sp. NPDC050153 TaxID=3364359 RepID=UPI00378C3973
MLRLWRDAGSPRPLPPDSGTLSPATAAKVYRGAIKPIFKTAMQLRPYPKGKRQRAVPICRELATLLARHATGKNPGRPLFQGRAGGYIDYANQRNNVLQPALEHALVVLAPTA